MPGEPGENSQQSFTHTTDPRVRVWYDPQKAHMEPEVVDSSVDRIARAIFDRWTQTPVIEFSESIEDAIFLEAAASAANLTGNDVSQMSTAEILKNPAILYRYNEILEQFLANLESPEFEKVWMDVAGSKAGAGGRTRNKKDNNTMSAKAFLKKFTPTGKSSSVKPKHGGSQSKQPANQYVSPQPMLFAPVSAQAAPAAAATQDWFGVLESLSTTTPAVEAKPQSQDILLKAQQQQSQAAPVPQVLASSAPTPPPAVAKATPSATAAATASDVMDFDELMANIGVGDFGTDALDDLDFAQLDEEPVSGGAAAGPSGTTAPNLGITTADLDDLFDGDFPGV